MSNDIYDQIERARDFARAKAATTADRLKEGSATALTNASEARKKAGAAYAGAKDKTFRAADAANRLINEHPLAATAAAVAAGAAIAMLFPKVRGAMKSAARNAPDVASGALARARALGEAAAESELAANVRSRAGELTASARDIAADAASATKARAIEIAGLALERASDAASTARTAIGDADIPGLVRTKAMEAAHAARVGIEKARIPQKASRLAETAASHTGEALIAAGKKVRETLDPQ
ncbi:hypothetical protein [Sphingobium aquiterrae]|uniref:hypothetical protein n=1 Tax=Sphingobium aquiterrae TaxID=2038656 RepID=UPI003016B722